MSKSFSERRTNNIAEPRRAVIWSPDARVDLSEIWDYYVGVAGGTLPTESYAASLKCAAWSKSIRLPVALATRCGQACDQLQLVLMSSAIA